MRLLVLMAFFLPVISTAAPSLQDRCTATGMGHELKEFVFDDIEESTAARVCMLNSVKDGPYEKNYPNGSTEITGEFKNGERTGHWTRYYPNGKKRDEGNLNDGEPTGQWFLWDKNGVMTTQTFTHVGFFSRIEKNHFQAGWSYLFISSSYQTGSSYTFTPMLEWRPFYPISNHFNLRLTLGASAFNDSSSNIYPVIYGIPTLGYHGPLDLELDLGLGIQKWFGPAGNGGPFLRSELSCPLQLLIFDHIYSSFSLMPSTTSYPTIYEVTLGAGITI